MIYVKKFSASWCGPCRALAPAFEQIKKLYDDVRFVEVDVETDDTVVELYNVRTVPTVIIEKDNQILERFVGIQSKQKYIDAINSARETT